MSALVKHSSDERFCKENELYVLGRCTEEEQEPQERRLGKTPSEPTRISRGWTHLERLALQLLVQLLNHLPHQGGGAFESTNGAHIPYWSNRRRDIHSFYWDHLRQDSMSVRTEKSVASDRDSARICNDPLAAHPITRAGD